MQHVQTFPSDLQLLQTLHHWTGSFFFSWTFSSFRQLLAAALPSTQTRSPALWNCLLPVPLMRSAACLLCHLFFLMHHAQKQCACRSLPPPFFVTPLVCRLEFTVYNVNDIRQSLDIGSTHTSKPILHHVHPTVVTSKRTELFLPILLKSSEAFCASRSTILSHKSHLPALTKTPRAMCFSIFKIRTHLTTIVLLMSLRVRCIPSSSSTPSFLHLAANQSFDPMLKSCEDSP